MKGKERESKIYIYIYMFKDDISSLNGLKTKMQSMQNLEESR